MAPPTAKLRNRSVAPKYNNGPDCLEPSSHFQVAVGSARTAGIGKSLGARTTLRRWADSSSRRRRILVGALASVVIIFSAIYALDVVFYSYGIGSHRAGGQTMRPPSESFAVVINTYKRPDRLHYAVNHYAQVCGKSYGVAQVFVIWSEPNTDPPALDSFFEEKLSAVRNGQRGRRDAKTTRSEVAIVRVKKDSLNSRFLPIQGLRGAAVFMVDDDVHVDCSSLSRGFDAWQTSPDSMVGFYPRLASLPLFEGSGMSDRREPIVYHTFPIVWLKGKFNMILTKAAFLHSEYLDLYSGATHPQEIRDYIDLHKNCEDVAMSLLVANATRGSMDSTSRLIYVEGSVVDTGLFGGISTGSGHMLTRSDCLTDLTHIYIKEGWGTPLFDVRLAEQSWLRHFPGFWWQISPSNAFEWFSFGNMLS